MTSQAELDSQMRIIELAGRICYASDRNAITDQTAVSFIKKLIASGHESVIEHSNLSVLFYDVSRGFTHEIVRHRHTAFSQRSTRYVKEDQASFNAPPHRDATALVTLNDGQLISYADMIDNISSYYTALLNNGWRAEDARQILPTAVTTKIIVSTNFREWRSIFKLRTHKSAHWEIRNIMRRLLSDLQMLVPVFDDIKGDET